MTARIPAAALLIGSLALLLTIDSVRSEDPRAPVADTVSADALPMQNAPSALSSTWFCAGGTADDERFADHTVILANEHGADASVDITIFSGAVAEPTAASAADALGDPNAPAEEPVAEDAAPDESAGTPGDVASATLADPVTTTVALPARGTVRVRLGDLVTAPIASALVEADRGGITVDHEIRSIHGVDVAACATRAATEFHFAWGRTTVDARQLFVVFNPFPDDAIIDGEFITETGRREPLRYDGFVVPARSTVALDLGDDVTRREQVTATLRLRSGRAVIDRIVRRNGDAGPRGITIAGGVSTPQESWVFADGIVTDAIAESYVVYNPGDATLEAEIELIVDDPRVNGIPEAIELTLPPRTFEVIDLDTAGFLPPQVGHGAVARSLNGTPFVVERVIAAQGDLRRGISAVTGSPVLAEQWTFPGGDASDTIDQWLYIMNLEPVVIAEIDVFVLGGGGLVPVDGLQGFEIGAASRAAIPFNDFNRGQRPIVIRSSEPIMVERGVYDVGAESRGLANVIGIPDEASAVAPPTSFDAVVDVDLGDLDTSTTSDDIPVAPDDVELPEPDEVIDPDQLDPDADQSPPSSVAPTTAPAGVPETTPTTVAADSDG